MYSVFLQLLGEEEKEIGRLYRQLLALFVICWTIYPILFIVGHNGGVLGHSTVLEVITVPLEIVAKGLAGIVVCAMRLARRQSLPAFAPDLSRHGLMCFSLSMLCIVTSDCLHVPED